MAKHGCATSGAAWVGVAGAPIGRLVVALVVGKRTQAQANRLLARVNAVTAAPSPFCTSDQWPASTSARLPTDGAWYQPERTGDRGRYPARRRTPGPGLRAAHVLKRRVKGRVGEVPRQIVCGAAAALDAQLTASPTRTTRTTRVVERDNLTWREHHRRLTRKPTAFSKALPWMEQQLWRTLASDPFGLPHASRRAELPRPAGTRGTGSPRPWRPVTPAMAAGMTDHGWTTSELLSYRVPATFLDTLDARKHLFSPLDATHHVS